MNLSQTLIRPVLTEKSTHQETAGKYTFMVHDDATKVDIKNALRTLYGVQVEKVNILHGLPKYRMGKSRKPMEKRASVKRAIITLKAGEKLEISKHSTTSTKKSTKKVAAAA
ncbi:MAG: 50S ribosomal protein L23 [Candidatus Gracilibacteria bacterium]|jgi:large subunit ribosomal protein L23